MSFPTLTAGSWLDTLVEYLANTDPRITAFQIATLSYLVSFDNTVLFCRFCGHTTREAQHVEQRYCPTCRLYHDNDELVKALKKQQGIQG